MTKPTGRPRGRPKTKEYVTLMARVPQDLAERTQRYAGRKRQTISEVLRDGLLVLLQDDTPYRPFASDRNAAADIMSDEKEEEEPPDAQPVIVSYTKEALPDNVSDTNIEIVSDIKEGNADIVSDEKEDQSYIMSDTKEETPAIMSYAKGVHKRKRVQRDNVSYTNAEQKKVSDTKKGQPDILPDIKEGKAVIASDTKKARARKQAKRPAKRVKRS